MRELRAKQDEAIQASTWLIYLSSCLFGGVSKLSAVLPSAIAAALTVVITYHIGLLHSARLAICSVLMLFFTLMFLKSARTLSLDMYPVLFTSASFYLVYSATVLKKPARSKWVYPLFLLSFIFRGPIGLVMPTGVVCVYYLFARKYKSFLVTGVIASILLVLATLALLALAQHVGGDAFMRDVLRMEVVGRIDNYYQPIYFYFVESFASYALSYPIAVFVMVSLLLPRPVAKDRLLLLALTGWALVILIGMSIPGDKKIRYVLAMAPALALLSAYPWSTTSKAVFGLILKQLLQILFLIFPSICLLALWLLHRHAEKQILAFTIEYARLAMIFMFMQVLNIGYYLKRDQQFISLLFIATTSFYIAYVGMAESVDLYLNRAQALVSRIEKERVLAGAQLVFYKERPDGLAIKYRINMPVLSQPQFIETETQLEKYHGRAYFVTNQSAYEALPKKMAARFKLIAQDHLGHAPVVIFTKK